MNSDFRIIGFTGTQRGMSDRQRRAVKDILDQSDADIFLHGGCIGADEQAAMIASNLGYTLIEYPSTVNQKRTALVSHKSLEPKPPLERNHDIVDDCDILVATPFQPEILRSGTWATVRYARSQKRSIIIIYRNGEEDYDR